MAESILELERHLKEEVKTLSAEKYRLEGEIDTAKEKAAKIVSKADRDASKIKQESESQAALVTQQLSVREKKVKTAEKVMKQLEDDAKTMEEESDALGKVKTELAREKRDMSIIRSAATEKESRANSLMERAEAYASEKGYKAKVALKTPVESKATPKKKKTKK